MARGQGKPKQRGASGDERDASSNVAGTKEDRGMASTPAKDRPGPRSAGGGRRGGARDEGAAADSSRGGGVG